MSDTGFFGNLFIFFFFVCSSLGGLIGGGMFGLMFLASKSWFSKFVGTIIIILTLLFSGFMGYSAISHMFEDASEKGDFDIELFSTLDYEKKVTVLNMSPTSESAPATSYVYLLNDGTEIGLNKRLHQYVQEYPTNSEFRILYYKNTEIREYDYEDNLFEEDVHGTPLIEADYVEFIK